MDTFICPRNDLYGENRLTTEVTGTGAGDISINNTDYLRATGGFCVIVSQDANGTYNIIEHAEYDSYDAVALTMHLNKRNITIDKDGVYDDTGTGTAHRVGAKVYTSDSALYWYTLLNKAVTFSGNLTLSSTWTAAGATCANLGIVSAATSITTSALVATTADINGGTIDGTAIGGSTPAAGAFTSITINCNSNADPSYNFLLTGDGDRTRLMLRGSGSGGAAVLSGGKCGGTISNPTATENNYVLSGVAAIEYDGTEWTGSQAGFLFFAAEAATPSARGTRFVLNLTPIGSTTQASYVTIVPSTGAFDLPVTGTYFSRAGTPITQKVGVSYIQYSGGDGAWEYNTGLTSVEGIMVLAVDDAANSGSDGWAKSTTNEYCITDQVAFNAGKLVEVGADCAVTAWNTTGGRFSVTWANATGRTIDMMIHYWGY